MDAAYLLLLLVCLLLTVGLVHALSHLDGRP
jgi:hypothetical protein